MSDYNSTSAMTIQSDDQPSLYALLIGIDHYLPGQLPDGTSYPNLRACVRDVRLVEEFFRGKLGLTSDHILTLTSSSGYGDQPPEPPDQWPTYENIVVRFEQLRQIAQSGDQVYIHYSGNGSRAKTIYPELKGPDALDNVLVPMDIHKGSARYLRDVELAYLLKTLVDKGIVPIVVLDTCYSGSLTRGQRGAVTRGVSWIDEADRPVDSLVAAPGELGKTRGRMTAGGIGNVEPASDWPPELKGYILLTACGDQEVAYEYSFDGRERNGALTYWLLDSLNQISPGLTYKMLHNRVLAKIHSQFPGQTPQLEGESDWLVFGNLQRTLWHGILVMQVDEAGERVRLKAGQYIGLRKGALLAVYPPRVGDFTQINERLALIEITDLFATDSWATIIKRLQPEPVGPGAQAVVLNTGSISLRRSVSLVRRDDLPSTIDQQTALDSVAQALQDYGHGFVMAVTDDEPAGNQVAVNPIGEYEIWDPAGNPIPNLRPAVRIDDPGAAARVVQRLVHLTKYQATLQIENTDVLSPLAGKLVVELFGTPPDYQLGEWPVNPPRLDGLGSPPTLQVGEQALLRIQNQSNQPLNIAVLDLQSDWGISQVFPLGPSDSFVELEPGEAKILPLRAALPEGYTEARDILKVFATVRPTAFDWLELPPLDQSIRGTRERRVPTNPLEELLAAVTAETPTTRHVNPSAYPTEDWVTAQVEVRVQSGLEEQTSRSNQQAIQLFQRGEVELAIDTAIQAMSLSRQRFGLTDPRYAESLNTLAFLYSRMGNYIAAEPLYQQALHIQHQSLGPKHLDLVPILNNLAELYRATGKLAEAELLYRQVLDIQRSTFGENHPDFAFSLDNLAGLYRQLGDYNTAEPLYRQALDIRRRVLGEEHPSYADVLDALGSLYTAMGYYAQADPILQQALKVRVNALGEQHPEVAVSLANLAEYYHKAGNDAAAEPYYRQALGIWRKALGQVHPNVARTLDSLARLQQAQGYYTLAEPLAQEAIEIWRRALGNKHPDVAIGLTSLAALYRARGQYSEAEPLYQQAIEIQQRALGEVHPDVASTLAELAGLYRVTGRYADAESLLCQALRVRQQALGDNHPAVADSLTSLAELYQVTGRYAEAELLYHQAVQVRYRTVGEQHPDFAASLDVLATLYAATDRPVEALSLMQAVHTVDDQMIRPIFTVGSERLRQVYLTTLRERVDRCLSLVIRHLQSLPEPLGLALDLVLRRKALDVEAFAPSRYDVVGKQYPDDMPKLSELTTLLAQMGLKTLAGPEAEDLEAYRQRLADWRSQIASLEAELARKIPALDVERTVQAADRRAVAAALPAGTTLVEFVRFHPFDFQAVPAQGDKSHLPARYLAFVLPAGEPDQVTVIDLGEVERIAQMIAHLRTSLVGETFTPTDRGIIVEGLELSLRRVEGLSLRAAIFDPLLPALGGCREVILAADGELVRLPFEVLPVGDGRFLIDDYNFSYLQVGRDILRFRAEPGPSADPLVIADPNFDLKSDSRAGLSRPFSQTQPELDRPALQFMSLPGTRAEGEHIASLLGVQPWLEASVLETRIKTYRSPYILHLATHAFFLTDLGTADSLSSGHEAGATDIRAIGSNPLLRAGLALAGANTVRQAHDLPEADLDDGLLTALEISRLDLTNTELVVLSACEPGLGELDIDLSMRGLQRAFTLAGARALLMTLWKVPDLQTKELMSEFYRRVLDGQPRRQALREARLALRTRYPDPLYWGAFIYQGAPGPLPAHVNKVAFEEAFDPYVVGRPLRQGELFVGRSDVLKKITDNLKPGAGQNILALSGQRRTGKTSVLRHLLVTLPKENGGAFLPVLFDIQGVKSSVMNPGKFFYILALQIWMDLKSHSVSVPKPQLTSFDADPAIGFEYEFLPEVTESLGNRRILLMLDEFESLKELIDRGSLGSDVLDYFRHLMQHTPVLFLIAGTYRLREPDFTSGYWAVFFNLVEYVDISILPEPATRELITEPVKVWYKIDNVVVGEIVRVTGCHPYFTQLVCKKLLEVRNESHVDIVTMSHLEQALKQALRTGDENIGFPWTEPDSTADERLILSVLAGEGRPLAESVLRQRLDEAGLVVSISEAMLRLQRRGILRQDNQKRRYFVVPLLQNWIRDKGFHVLAEAVKFNQDKQRKASAGGI